MLAVQRDHLVLRCAVKGEQVLAELAVDIVGYLLPLVMPPGSLLAPLMLERPPVNGGDPLLDRLCTSSCRLWLGLYCLEPCSLSWPAILLPGWWWPLTQSVGLLSVTR